jgi:hypothetical protein
LEDKEIWVIKDNNLMASNTVNIKVNRTLVKVNQTLVKVNRTLAKVNQTLVKAKVNGKVNKVANGKDSQDNMEVSLEDKEIKEVIMEDMEVTEVMVVVIVLNMEVRVLMAMAKVALEDKVDMVAKEATELRVVMEIKEVMEVNMEDNGNDHQISNFYKANFN